MSYDNANEVNYFLYVEVLIYIVFQNYKAFTPWVAKSRFIIVFTCLGNIDFKGRENQQVKKINKKQRRLAVRKFVPGGGVVRLMRVLLRKFFKSALVET